MVILTNPTTVSIILHSDSGFTSAHEVRYFTKNGITGRRIAPAFFVFAAAISGILHPGKLPALRSMESRLFLCGG